MFRKKLALLIVAISVTSVCAASVQAQVNQTPAGKAPLLKAPGGSANGLLVKAGNQPVYGFANLQVTNWLGLKVFRADFVQFTPNGPVFGSVAIAPSAQPGVYLWISDKGPAGVLTATPAGVTWTDSSQATGRYIPL